MRTTLNLDEKAVAYVRQVARQQNRSMGSIASELILRAISQKGQNTPGQDVTPERNGVPLFTTVPDTEGSEAPDLETVNRLRDE